MSVPLLITGAGAGIGRAVARRAVNAGQPVGLLDADAASLEEIVDQLESAGGEVFSAVCDVSVETEIGPAVEEFADRLGAPAGLVTSSGIDRGAPLHRLDSDDWDAVIRVNLRGTFFACREVVGRMIDGDGGAIVCVSSPLARVAVPGGTAAYSASKAGVSALVRSLAVDYAQRGVRANAVLPGPTETQLMWANVATDEIGEARRKVASEVPLGRLADPDEIAGAITWLLSDEASFVTGAELACDGGVLAQASVSV